MHIFRITTSIIFVISIIFLFYDWKIAIGLFILASTIHVIPKGPNALLSVITGFLIIVGIVYLFINWKIGVALIIGGFFVAKFRVWAADINYRYYSKNEKENLK